VRVGAGSPAEEAGLAAFEDVVIAIDGTALDVQEKRFSMTKAMSTVASKCTQAIVDQADQHGSQRSSSSGCNHGRGSLGSSRSSSTKKQNKFKRSASCHVIDWREEESERSLSQPRFSTYFCHSLQDPVVLTVYNDKLKTSRDVTITPARRWQALSWIGVTARFDPLLQTDVELPV